MTSLQRPFVPAVLAWLAMCQAVGCTTTTDACGGAGPAACLAQAQADAATTPMARDPELIHAAMELACAADHGPACAASGIWLTEGHPAPLPGLAADRLDRACSLGEAASCWQLGSLLMGQDLASPDPLGALAAFEQGCQGRHAQSCVDAGVLHRLGRAAAPDDTTAYARFQTACALGDLRGCTQQALAVRDGRGIVADGPSGVQQLEDACAKDYAPACGLAALAYELGDGVAADPLQRAELLVRGAGLGDDSAIDRLTALRGDPVLGARVAAFAAELSTACDTAPPEDVGATCRRAARLATDPATAEPTLRKACSAQDAPACGLLGGLIAEGLLPKRDGDTTTMWLEQGCREAQPLACWHTARTELVSLQQQAAQTGSLPPWSATRVARTQLKTACRGGIQPACEAWKALFEQATGGRDTP